MVKNLFRNRGSLHNRVTARICLMPFTLNECERYAAERGLEMSRGELAECYMVFGGIPYYWRTLQQGLSLAQNIDRTVFSAAAPLRHEFGELYRSLFRSSRIYERVVSVMARKKIGMTRSEIIAAAGGELAGALSVFQAVTKTRQALYLTLVTSFGLLRNKHSGRVQSEVTLDDLFQECRT